MLSSWKNKNLALIVLLACFFLFLYFSKVIIIPSISVRKGLIFINRHYNNGAYQDEYLNYVYPKENINCPECPQKITYRLLDAYFDVKFLLPLIFQKELLERQNKDAEFVFNNLLQKWENVSLYNAISETNYGEKENGMAADTYCILGYIYNSKKFAENALLYVKDKNLIKDDYYADAEWRNIADETWCLRLFIKTKTAAEIMETMLKNKIEETENFLKTHGSYDNFAALYHMIFLLKEAGENYNPQKEKYENMLLNIAEKNEDPLILGNALDALSESPKYEKKLKKIAAKLMAEQNFDGSWDESVFTTFRAVIGLSKYRLPKEK